MPKDKNYHRVTFTYEGKRYERKGKTLNEAHAKAAELRLSLERGEVGVSGNMTVRRWGEEWLETYKQHSVGNKQYKDYASRLNNIINVEIGNMPIKNVKDIHLQKILNSRAGNSKSDVSKTHNTIKGLFRQAFASGLIVKNPAEFLVQPKSHSGTHRAITKSERQAILEVSKTHKAGLWILLMLYCGLRPGECRALQWRHIDFEKQILNVCQSMKADSRIIGSTKSEAGVRSIPMPKPLYDALRVAKGGPYEPVLQRETPGLYHTDSSMRKMWDRFVREVDLHMGAKLYRNKVVVHAIEPGLTPYCLRHTYCTDLQDAGVPINIARYLMGHSSIEMTSRIYTHTTEEAIKIAADLIDLKQA